MSKVVVRCAFCDDLFYMERPLFFTERDRAACPKCSEQAKKNTPSMQRPTIPTLPRTLPRIER